MNIYDEKLHRIEKAEKKVRIAKTKLFEAEKELDETFHDLSRRVRVFQTLIFLQF